MVIFNLQFFIYYQLAKFSFYNQQKRFVAIVEIAAAIFDGLAMTISLLQGWHHAAAGYDSGIGGKRL